MDRMINGTSILVLPSKLSTSIFKIPPYSDLYKILDHKTKKNERREGDIHGSSATGSALRVSPITWRGLRIHHASVAGNGRAEERFLTVSLAQKDGRACCLNNCPSLIPSSTATPQSRTRASGSHRPCNRCYLRAESPISRAETSPINRVRCFPFSNRGSKSKSPVDPTRLDGIKYFVFEISNTVLELDCN